MSILRLCAASPCAGRLKALAWMSWSVMGVSGLCRRADQHNPDSALTSLHILFPLLTMLFLQTQLHLGGPSGLKSHPLCKAGQCHRKGTWLGSHRTVFKSCPDTTEPEGEKNKGTACEQGPA